MPTCEALISMSNPQRCLLRLCKHWGHKFTVKVDGPRGHIDFGDSSCEWKVVGTQLQVCLQVAEQEDPTALQEVVAEHLQRMVIEPLQVDWRC